MRSATPACAASRGGGRCSTTSWPRSRARARWRVRRVSRHEQERRAGLGAGMSAAVTTPPERTEPRPGAEVLVEVRQLSVEYGGERPVRAVDDVDLSIR